MSKTEKKAERKNKQSHKRRNKPVPTRPRLTVLRLCRHVGQAEALADEYGLHADGLYVLLGNLKQKPSHCVIMTMGSGHYGDFPRNIFEVVPKGEMP